MNIAVISHAYQDERYLKTLEAMATFPDVNITLIHPENYQGKKCCWRTPHLITRVPLRAFLTSRQGAFLYSPSAFTRAIDQCKPDVLLHEQEVYALNSLQIAAIAQHRSIPLVQFVWENVDRRLSFARRLLRRSVLSRVTAIIAGSSGARDVHVRCGFSQRIGVMPQMSVYPVETPQLGRRGETIFKVCFVGRLVSCKGTDCLLRAIARMHERGYCIECAIAGSGPDQLRLAMLTEKLAIRKNVSFHGHLNETEIRRLMRSNDVLVLPSRRTPVWEEQFGLVLAEAMAEGTIPVGSRTGAIPELIGAPELLFDEDDAQGLTEVLQRLNDDPDFYLWSQLHAWQRAGDRFSSEIAAKEKINFLRGIAEQGRVHMSGSEAVPGLPDASAR